MFYNKNPDSNLTFIFCDSGATFSSTQEPLLKGGRPPGLPNRARDNMGLLAALPAGAIRAS